MNDTGVRLNTTFALARFEAGRLVRSIAFWVGIAGSAFIVVAVLGTTASREPIIQSATLLSVLVHPMCAALVFSFFRISSRSRRHSTDELFDVCPTPRAGRTAGQLGAAWPAALFGLVFALSIILDARVAGGDFGPIDLEVIAEVLTAVTLVIGACWLGVLLGRCTKFGLMPILVVFAILLVEAWLWSGAGDHAPPRTAQLAAAATSSLADVVFNARPVGWHLLYVAGLAGLCAVAAVATTRRSRAVAGLALALLVITIAASTLAIRPKSDAEAARVADFLEHPDAHQVCVGRGPVTACAFEKYSDVLTELLDASDGVVAATPVAVQTKGFRITQRLHPRELGGVDATVRAKLSPSIRAAVLYGYPEDGAWHVAFVAGREVEVATRLAAGAWAVGLPLSQRAFCDASNQARAVVAMWLASQDLPPNERDDVGLFEFSQEHSSTESPVGWSSLDADAARRLLDRPRDAVLAVVHANWSHYTDPATSTAALMADFGVAFPPYPAAPPCTP